MGGGPFRCALPSEDVVETFRPVPVRPLSAGAGSVRGIAIVRGEALAVVDLAAILTGKPERNPARFVTARSGQRKFALAVGAVECLVDIAPEALGPASETFGSVASDAVAAVAGGDGDVILVLRTDRLAPHSVSAEASRMEPGP